MKKTTKTEMVKQHLLTKKTITSLEAINLYSATRLAAIIFILREQGWVISSKDVPFVDRYKNKSRYAKYEYIGHELPNKKDNQLNINF